MKETEEVKKHTVKLSRRGPSTSFTSLHILLSSSSSGRRGPIHSKRPSRPGANFDKADFHFWLPKDSGPVRAIVVLVPGSNGDGRQMADDAFWQEFATKQRGRADLGCRFTDKPHDQSFIEDYVNVSQGSGQALLDVIGEIRRAHRIIRSWPARQLLLWGMSAGGQFNYEFTAWKPERVAAFIVNKGGIYYSALVSKAARDGAGLLFVGGNDLESRIDTITGLFAVNRRGGAVWALVVEPGLAHVVGHSKELGALFFEDVLERPSVDRGIHWRSEDVRRCSRRRTPARRARRMRGCRPSASPTRGRRWCRRSNGHQPINDYQSYLDQPWGIDRDSFGLRHPWTVYYLIHVTSRLAPQDLRSRVSRENATTTERRSRRSIRKRG